MEWETIPEAGVLDEMETDDHEMTTLEMEDWD